jgi:transposase
MNQCVARSLGPGTNLTNPRPRSLAQVVERAVRVAEARIRAPVPHFDAYRSFHARALLALLTFCYARQIYGSTQIAGQLRGDANLRRWCGEEIPDARALRRFRSENRVALDFCLTQALRFIAEQKVTEGIVTRVNEAHLAEEAGRRITMAMFTDSLELDREHNSDAPAEICYLVA